MKDAIKQAGRGAVRPIGRALARAGVSANAVTALGALFAVPAAYGFYVGDPVLAFTGLLLSGLCDLIDGAVARADGGAGTPFGAAFDSTLDRYGEGLVLGAILLGLAERDAAPWILALALLAGVGSFLVSYVRARAEGLGYSGEVGILERSERIVLLLILALWGDAGAPWILGVIAVLSHITFVQRLVHVRAQSRAQPPRDSARRKA